MQETTTTAEGSARLWQQKGRPWVWLVLAVLAWLGALVFDRYQHEYAREQMTHRLQQWIQEQDARVDELAAEELTMRTYLLDKRQMPAAMYTAFTERMVRLSGLPFALYYTLHDSLIYWNHGVPGLDVAQLPGLRGAEGLLHLDNGWYLPRVHLLSDSVTLYALIPLKQTFEAEGPFLRPYFPGNPDLPGEVQLREAAGDWPLHRADGTVLGYLDFNGAAKTLPREYLALLLFLLAGLFTLMAGHGLAAHLMQRGYRQWGPLLFLVAVFGLRALSIALDFTGHFRQMPLFHRAMEHPLLSHSIGDLLINISLLLWVIIFFYRELPVPDFSGLPRLRRWGIALINYLAIACGLLALILLFQILVLDSDITFRFDDIFNFNTYSFLSLLAVQLLLIALFLYVYRVLLFINRTGLSRGERMSALAVSGLVAVLVAALLDMPVPLGYLALILGLYLLLFEFYADVRISNLTWTILWMILFSGLASGFLYHFNNTKIDRRLAEYAHRLINPRDSLLEERLEKVVQAVAAGGSLEERLREEAYIRHYYQWAEEDALPREGTWSWVFKEEELEYRLVHSGGSERLLSRSVSDTRQVYVELLRHLPFKGIPDLDLYRFDLSRGEEHLQRTLSAHALFQLREQLARPEAEYWFRSRQVRGQVLRRGDLQVIITYESSGRGEYLSLFSYLFCLLTVTLFFITLLNTVFSFLPDTLNFSLSHRLSLRNRIQFSVISLIVLSFLIIGMITIFYFKNTTRQYHQERLQRKALGVAKDLEGQLARAGTLDSLEVSRMLPAMARVHETDIDIFSPEGRLLHSSEPQVYRQQLVAPLMEGRALAALLWEGKSLYIGERRIGQLEYQTAYVPLPPRNGQAAGYLAVPYYTDRTFLQRDISEFISALLNVYVFLLFIAGALAILVANSITYPLSVIGEKLKQFKLGKQNEPLEWSSRDELGELIGEYNRMIRKLQESALLLARSEREGAWREMAKQVAHEIKNPLTPMKLSLQHLQHAFRPAREEDQALLNRVSATLIEQIENLSQIASAFSNFARIPEAHPEELVVNDLIQSVHNLFSENDLKGLDISVQLPDEPIAVLADKNQLLRVLNNLVKNAIQAIPEDRTGRVHIALRREGEMARITVEDNGRGIPLDMQEKVFMPNFTTKSSGMGLGLAICRNIVDQMSGRIFFETHPGSGTRFVVELPVL